MRKCWYPAFFPFFTMFSTPLRDQSHSLIHILFVLCRRFRLTSLKFYLTRRWKLVVLGQKAQVSDSRAIMALFSKQAMVFTCPHYKSLEKMLEKEKLLVTSNFSFSNSVSYPFGKLSAIVIKFEIVVCRLFQFGKV